MLENKDIATKLADMHDKYVVVPAHKASNNVVFVFKNMISNVYLNNLVWGLMVSQIKLIKYSTYFLTTNQLFRHMHIIHR